MVNDRSQQPKRILLKLSGEALQGSRSSGIDVNRLAQIAAEIAPVVELGVQVAIVIGAGNFVRGADYFSGTAEKIVKIDRITADQMGMLATVMNGLALRDIFNAQNLPAKIMSAWSIQGIAEGYNRSHALEALNQNNILIFVGGTGNPLVTTDTAAALRGIEIQADILLKATKVDGVFSADPVKHPDAERYTNVSYTHAIQHRLAVMDLSAIILCQENKLPVRVFDFNQSHILLKIIQGEKIGTLIGE